MIHSLLLLSWTWRCVEEYILQIETSSYQYQASSSSAKGEGNPEDCYSLPAIHKVQMLKYFGWYEIWVGWGLRESPVWGK